MIFVKYMRKNSNVCFFYYTIVTYSKQLAYLFIIFCDTSWKNDRFWGLMHWLWRLFGFQMKVKSCCLSFKDWFKIMVIFSAVTTELPEFPQFPLIVLMLCINSINKIITCLALNKYHPFQLHRAKDSNSFLSSHPKITNGW